jgi:Protein of unknown function (DUF2628)
MASWIVMEPAGSGRAADATFVRDGFSFLAFLVPPLWLLLHRLWIEATLAIAALVLTAALAQLSGLATTVLLWLLVSLFVGLEGNALRIAALRRRGWQDWGVVEAGNVDDADAHYAVETVGADTDADLPALPSPPSVNSSARAVAGEPVGLLLNPGR